MANLLTREAECPACGASGAVPILYGRYRRDDREALLARYPDGYMLGGCFVSGFRPNRVCRACRVWYRFESPAN